MLEVSNVVAGQKSGDVRGCSGITRARKVVMLEVNDEIWQARKVVMLEVAC
jgi:hypothetical protein